MMVEHQKLKEGTENEYETYSELETLNSMIPLWKKNKSELKDEDYNQFYKEKFYVKLNFDKLKEQSHQTTNKHQQSQEPQLIMN